MPDSHNKLFFQRHLWIIYLLSVILLAIVWYFQWILGLVMTVFVITSFIYSISSEKTFMKRQRDYISTLSYRIKNLGKEALLEMPIGIVLYDENYQIEWCNYYMNQFSEEDSLIGASLENVSDKLVQKIADGESETWLSLGSFRFQVAINQKDRLLYFFDRTAQFEIQERYENEQTFIAMIFLDNYEEITQNMDDTLKSMLNSRVTATLNEWSNQYGLYLKRTSQDRFLAIGTSKSLKELEQTKFDILDKVRELEIDPKLNNSVTLSIGIGYGDVRLPKLGELAQSSLDLALGRGGDQVAIKGREGNVRFYGGKTSPMEKRTRVRARVISHALGELVKASDKVMIMGHKSPDMDSIGAAIGILNIAKSNNVQGYIVFDHGDIHRGIQRMMETIQEDESLWRHFISPDEAESMMTDRSLMVVVDTHRPSMVPNERLLYKTEYRVVIDHHRRGEEFIENPTLVYMEPYASSTCELVTELLEYQPKKVKLKMLEATCLLAGIIVDTKSFTLRTGSRTFDAASYLRARGADTILVQQFLKEDLDIYLKRSQLIERTEIYRHTIAIAKADEDEVFDKVVIAQAADTLLTMNGVMASFVISKFADGKVGISARSLGDINVQVIMEQMAGGGHLTNAATQIENLTIDEAEALLKNILDEYFEGRE